MKNAMLLIFGFLIGFLSILFFPFSKDDKAVIVGPEYAGKIVGYTDTDHVFVSTDNDSTPEFIVSVDEQNFEDIVYQKMEKGGFENIRVHLRSINGSVFRFTGYEYIDTNTDLHPYDINSTRIAWSNDKLIVINGVQNVPRGDSFIHEISMADYTVSKRP